MAITKKGARNFLEDFECGDILAIKNLKHTNRLKGHDDIVLNWYLDALDNLNSIMIDMEEDVIPWDEEFNDLYRKAMELMCNKCNQILRGGINYEATKQMGKAIR